MRFASPLKNPREQAAGSRPASFRVAKLVVERPGIEAD